MLRIYIHIIKNTGREQLKKHLSHNLLSTISLGAILLTAGAGQTVFAAEEASIALDEIIVTARKTEESLQSVPVAITAFSGADLAIRGISDITELQQQSPNTTLQVSRGTNSTLTAFIRGIGQQDRFGALNRVLVFILTMSMLHVHKGRFLKSLMLHVLRFSVGHKEHYTGKIQLVAR